MRLLVFFIAAAAPCLPAVGQERTAERRPSASLALIGPEGAQVVDLHVSIDDTTFDEYWDKAFDAIFVFADSDGSGLLTDEEIHLVPSARALRLALGSGFTPPVASLRNVKDVLQGSDQACTKEALKQYYRRHRAGGIQVGFGKLQHTAALTEALVHGLDQDKNGLVSKSEFSAAENSLNKLDANDDELIGAGELLPNCVYPGCAGTNDAYESLVADLSDSNGAKLFLVRLPLEHKERSELFRQVGDRVRSEAATADRELPTETANWNLAISGESNGAPLSLGNGKRVRCEAWSVAGPLAALYQHARDEITESETTQNPPASTDGDSKGRKSEFGWLEPLVDRNHDGEASSDEINAWLEVQRQLSRGQLLVSVFYGGGLFEMLDVNHDAGLSPRELRNAWLVLETAACTSGEDFDPGKAPAVVQIIASQGYPAGFARTTAGDVEWFRTMDRNSDGDISRREFTGSIKIFSKLDADRDGLISIEEAKRAVIKDRAAGG